MVGFSQTTPVNSKLRDEAKAAVDASQSGLLESLQRRLQSSNEKKVTEFKKLTVSQQFLFNESLIDSVLKPETHSLNDVFKKLCKKENMPTDFSYEGVVINENITGKNEIRKDRIESTTVIIPVSFQSRTISKGGISDVKYATTFTWEVKIKYIKGGYEVQNPQLVSSVATPILFLNSERNSMREAARKAIVEWYENLPQTLDKQYANQSITAIKAMQVSPEAIKIDVPQGRTFTVSAVPAIKIDIDPYQHIKEIGKPLSLYTNPVASLEIAPEFKVTFDETNKNASVSVEYIGVIPKWPIPDDEKEMRRNKANSVVAEFAQKLASYVASRDAGKKDDIEGLFNSEGNEVEVSYLRLNGTERITTKPVQKYLSLLKGTDLNMVVDDDVEVLDPNWDSLIYTVSQEFHSKPYSDNTIKRIHMTYDSAKETYVINKVEVVPSSTKLIN